MQHAAGLHAGGVARSTSPSTGSTPTTSTSPTSTRATTRCAPTASTRTSRPGARGEYDWQGFDARPSTTRRLHAVRASTRRSSTSTTSRPGTTSRRPATRRRRQLRLRPVYRSQSLDERIEPRIAGPSKMSLPELIDAMEDAGTVDLRGDAGAAAAARGDRHARATRSRPARSTTLQAWVDGGRPPASTATGTASTTTPSAVRIMDAWWPRLLEAEFKPDAGHAAVRRGPRACTASTTTRTTTATTSAGPTRTAGTATSRTVLASQALHRGRVDMRRTQVAGSRRAWQEEAQVRRQGPVLAGLLRGRQARRLPRGAAGVAPGRARSPRRGALPTRRRAAPRATRSGATTRSSSARVGSVDQPLHPLDQPARPSSRSSSCSATASRRRGLRPGPRRKLRRWPGSRPSR